MGSNTLTVENHDDGRTGTASRSLRRRSRLRGLTLAEVMIAMTILGVIALVAFPTMLSFADLSDTARQQNVATHDLMSAVEDVISTPFSQLTTTYQQGQSIPKYQELHLPNETVVVTYDDPTADPLVVTLTMTYNDLKGRPWQGVFRCVRTR
jgi:prepilin-type N-terminal cleavage/methylation domain-containing protein